MARGLNRVFIIGNLAADPEIRYANSGSAIANITVGCSENKKDQSGAWKEQTEWVKCVFFGKQAETIKDYLRKGSKIYIEGRLQTTSWDDQKSGTKRYKTEVIGSQFIMLDSKGNTTQNKPQSPNPQAQDMPEEDPDLPF